MTRAVPERSASLHADPGAPRHIAIIMDGNGRWANERGLPRLAGHRAGADNLQRVLRTLDSAGVEFVTLFAFSTENWNRPTSEVNGLLDLMQTVIGECVDELHKRNVRIRHLGELDQIPASLAEATREAVALTSGNTGLNLCVAFDYGGRTEMIRAVRRIVAAGVGPHEITEDLIRENLYLPDVPDPDLIIRTAGEQRLSNFLIWQAAYSEYYQTPAYWPDFDGGEIERALSEYKRRRRRFGALPEEG